MIPKGDMGQGLGFEVKGLGAGGRVGGWGEGGGVDSAWRGEIECSIAQSVDPCVHGIQRISKDDTCVSCRSCALLKGHRAHTLYISSGTIGS